MFFAKILPELVKKVLLLHNVARKGIDVHTLRSVVLRLLIEQPKSS
jgi:hypothetical protein